MNIRTLDYPIYRFNFMHNALLFVHLFLLACASSAQPILMLRSDAAQNFCSITQLGDAVLMKERQISEGELSTTYKAFILPQEGYYSLNVRDASTGILLLENDTLWVDWIGKEERAIIRKGKSRELNLAMAAVDSLCDIRLLELLKFAAIRRSKEVKYFTDTLRKSYQEHPSERLQSYVFYRTAYVEIVAESDTRAKLMQKYFEQAAEPSNSAWIESFRNLFNGFLIQKLNARNGVKLQNAFREKLWQPLWTEFRNDSLAMHPEVREFAFLLGLNQLRSQNNFRDVSFEWMLDSLILQSAYPQVQHCAKTMRSEWSKYAKGSKVPDFTFSLLNGKQMRFSDLIGKPMYLCYYPNFSQSTYRELAMLQAFKERFKNEVEFLIVVKTNEKAGLIRALESINSTLLVSDWASCSEAFKEIPEAPNANGYFLINRKGRYFKAPAEGPETGVEDSFLGLVKD